MLSYFKINLTITQRDPELTQHEPRSAFRAAHSLGGNTLQLRVRARVHVA